MRYARNERESVVRANKYDSTGRWLIEEERGRKKTESEAEEAREQRVLLLSVILAYRSDIIAGLHKHLREAGDKERLAGSGISSADRC